MMTDSLVSAALDYAQRGRAVFPVKARGKTPLTTHGFKDASKDPAVIIAWWQRWPDANIGLPTGSASGFWVLDIDGEEGESSLRLLEQKHGALPATVEVITGGGGRHLYFAWPAQGGFSISAGELGTCLDVRGKGGYVVAPPSVHESGRKYQSSVDGVEELRSAPEWLLRLLREPAPMRGNSSQHQHRWQELLKGVTEGQRDHSLTRISGALFRSDLDPFTALELCFAWNDARCTPPLSAEEVLRTVDSIAGRELQQRGG